MYNIRRRDNIVLRIKPTTTLFILYYKHRPTLGPDLLGHSVPQRTLLRPPI